MKAQDNQSLLPFGCPRLEAESQLLQQWEKNRADDAHNWTDESMAMVWFLGCNDLDWWQSLPKYTREQVVAAYKFEQESLQWNGRKTIRPYREACHCVSKEEMAAFYERVENMAQRLAADWSANRPPSIFTYDSSVAVAVSVRLGRRVEAKPRSEQAFEVYP